MEWTDAPPSSEGRTGTPVTSATAAGPEMYASALGVMTTASARPSRSAGPDSSGPSRTATTGTTPEQRAKAFAARPQPSRAATPSPRSWPEDASAATNGNRRSSARPAATASASAPSPLSARPRSKCWTCAVTTGLPPGDNGPARTTTSLTFRRLERQRRARASQGGQRQPALDREAAPGRARFGRCGRAAPHGPACRR